MIISHTHKFIFIKTTKTAGTSVEIGLSKHCGDEDIITRISPADEALRTKTRGAQNSVVPVGQHRGRDWLRLVQRRRRVEWYNHSPASLIRSRVPDSIWNSYFRFTIERNPYDKAISRYFYSTRDMATRPSVEDYLATAPVDHVSNWPIYAIGDKLAVDYVIRYETLADGLRECCERIGIPTIVLPQAKSEFRKDRRHYSTVLNDAARERVETLCHRELDLFGYQWQDDAAKSRAA